MKRWWVSWYGDPDVLFTLHSPWWASGKRLSDDAATIVAAVLAEDEDGARRGIVGAHDVAVDLEWRFCDERPADWSPFCERFPRAGWMRWPEAT